MPIVMWPPSTRAPLALVLLGCGLCACSPAQTVRQIRLQFDPASRTAYGPEDAERWIAEETARINRVWQEQGRDLICDRVCAQRSVGLMWHTESFWRPSDSEVRRFERKLSRALERSRSDHRHDPPGALWEYQIQYIGYVRDGERLIYAQGDRCYDPSSCQGTPEHWFLGLDGGTSFFRASFNPESGELLDFGFNGYA